MFTGIVQGTGIVDIVAQEVGCKLFVRDTTLDLLDVQHGDSIAVYGVCLTVTDIGLQRFTADVSMETLARTTFADISLNAPVNLEKSLTLNSLLGGHLVSGHVDGTGLIIERSGNNDYAQFTVQAADDLMPYIAAKGSICIDGVSLTVNAVRGNVFDLHIVPHTLRHTTFEHFEAGHRVNLEVDIIARYVERLLNTRR